MIDVSKLSPEERAVVLARREYYRQWKKKNAEKVKATDARFFLKHAEKIAAEAEEEKKKPSE